MKLSKKILFFFILPFLIIFSQNKLELTSKIGGTVQAMASYAQTGKSTDAQIGFGPRRVRLKTYFGYDNVTAFVQGEVKDGFKLVDARMTYKFSKTFNVRVGRFVGASVRAGALTSHTKIDIVERSMSAQKWSESTLGVKDFRDYGVAFMGKVGEFQYNLTLANGTGATNITASQKSAGKISNKKISVGGMLNYKPKAVKGLEVGGYYGIGNSSVNNYSSYNAYAYWEPKPIRIKAEIIGVTNKKDGKNISTLGYYLFGAFGFSENWEALARYENYDPTEMTSKKDAETLITLGARYSLFPEALIASKITFAYVIHAEEGAKINNDVFYVMFQTIF